MALWAGLLTCATSGHGAQSREEERGGGTLLSVQPTQPGARGCPSALPLIPQWLWTGAWGGRMGTWAGRGPGWTARAVLAPGADEGTGSPLQSRACPQPSELLEGSRAHSRSCSSTGPPTPTPASAAGGLQRRSRRVRVLPWRPVPRPCGELVILISSCSLSGPLKLKAPPPNPHTPPE